MTPEQHAQQAVRHLEDAILGHIRRRCGQPPTDRIGPSAIARDLFEDLGYHTKVKMLVSAVLDKLRRDGLVDNVDGKWGPVGRS